MYSCGKMWSILHTGFSLLVSMYSIFSGSISKNVLCLFFFTCRLTNMCHGIDLVALSNLGPKLDRFGVRKVQQLQNKSRRAILESQRRSTEMKFKWWLGNNVALKSMNLQLILLGCKCTFIHHHSNGDQAAW